MRIRWKNSEEPEIYYTGLNSNPFTEETKTSLEVFT